MNNDAAAVRLQILQHFAEHGVPPVVETLMDDFALSREKTVGVLRDLADARHIALVKGTARILMAFPFSAIATPFRVTTSSVTTSGRSYFANCAWDAVAFHTMLGTDITIESYCHHCAAPIAIEMSDGRATRVEPADAIVYLALRPAQWWEDIITTCSNTMVFFASPDHRDASDLAAPADQAASLTPDEVHALGIPLYSRRLELDYERPGGEALLAHFAALGLTSLYWNL
jgi:Alkylmercury lyase